MGHQAPQPPPKPAPPSLKWPLIWLATTGYIIVADVVDFTVDRESDATSALLCFPFCLLALLAATAFYRKRIEQRQQWREQREFEWCLRAPQLPAPTDWQAFERGIDYRVGGGWHATEVDPSN